MTNYYRDNYIETINYYQDILRVIRDYKEDSFAITEYDSVFQDILDYQDNDFEDFKSNKEFEDFIKYLKELIIGGLD